MLLGPAFRLLANFEGNRGKQFLPQERCGDDVELAANRMPAYWERMRASANGDDAQQGEKQYSLAVASPPVMCWICGEGFLDNPSLSKHCDKKHGDYAEYRKRLFWRAQKDCFKPLLPWVKRHSLQSATFHTTYSVPGSFSLKWSHPDAMTIARERCEVACVVCARKDWLERRFSVYLWREADGSKTLSELQNVQAGTSKLLTCGSHLCFGNRHLINKFLATGQYSELMQLIPKEHLYASSVIHPEDENMSWLLHTRRVPLQPDSRKPLGSSAYTCAGVGDPDEVAWICYDCASCLCVEDERLQLPELALSNLLWLGREHPLLQEFGTVGLRMLLGLGRPCFRKMVLGKGNKDERQSGLTGNHILIAQPAAELGDVLPPTSAQLSASFVAIFGQSIEDLRK